MAPGTLVARASQDRSERLSEAKSRDRTLYAAGRDQTRRGLAQDKKGSLKHGSLS